MFVLTAFVTLAAGLLLTAYAGWNSFVDWKKEIDTTAEAADFGLHVGLTLVGLCVFVTGLHVAVS